MQNNSAAEMGAKGGKARAAKLTKTERSDIAREAAIARWGDSIAQATHTGVLKIGEIEFECAVLNDAEHTRVVSETNFMEAMGMYRSGALSTRRAKTETSARIPLSLAYKNLKPFIERHLDAVHFRPLVYRTPSGQLVTVGLPATIIPKVCEVWIDAAREGALARFPRQTLIARKADILHRGIAVVGITALVDEATGHQHDRASDALAQILEAFVAKELRKWVRTFPPDFYKEMFRLRNIPYNGTVKKPAYIGHLTNDLVYARLAPGVLQSLKAKNPVTESGRRKHRHHQWLTNDIGHPKLQEHLAAVTTLMKVSDSWDGLKAMMERAGLRKYSELPLFKDIQDEA